ncbi:Fis family transcriptional regulator [Parabacteroides sp. 52]|uniref:SoxR reducing system RseC family protein n=1 Tax=unclassified Parabacteroides TaxID=2649774 RepID=UPI0013D8049D|nr:MULTISPECIES: SoxR reducing system RseC family protein [unclassified Parabacteroides]MDH6533926.1 positive regulator of sigma E activity [Parabacteroides sp. PM5-20]NDV54671.1 Fis family transcriptional regulator [Parabacteroides sp. 52]
MKENIRHNGIVERIEANSVFVRIIQQSACAGCHARSMCSASDSKVKIIEVTDRSGRFHINDDVMICGQSSLGLQAVLFAFVIPLVLVFGAVALGMTIGWSETLSALAGLLLLVPYYVLLYVMRDKLKRRFVFTLELEKQNYE